MYLESMTLYSAVLLPLFLMYLLVTIRMFERRKIPYEKRTSVWSILSIRDAVLVTLALDVSEISSGFMSAFVDKYEILPIAVATMLLTVHMMVYFLFTTKLIHNESQPTKNSTRSILDVYFALTLLMTNAVTILDVMRALGKGL